MDKLILREIAKRWAKGILSRGCEASVSFDEHFSVEECEYIDAEIKKIANRITDLPDAPSVGQLVDEYYEPK